MRVLNCPLLCNLHTVDWSERMPAPNKIIDDDIAPNPNGPIRRRNCSHCPAKCPGKLKTKNKKQKK